MRVPLSTRAAFARRIVLAVCSIAAAMWMTSLAHAGDLRVMVRTAAGSPADGASVCAGTPQQPVQYGSARTNASGVAVLSNVPAGPMQVIAHVGQSGQDIVYQMGSASPQSITVRLPVAMTMKTCGPSVGAGLAGNPRIESSQPQEPTKLKLGDAARPSGKLTLSTQPRIPIKREYCFGALGAQCGGAQHNLPTTALCGLGYCSINAGSWEHDECCFANPQGMACQAGPLDYATGHDGKCVNEWNKALARLNAGLNWTRRIDFNKPNGSGRVEFSSYCAETGARVHPDDVRYCCSRQADPAPVLPGLPALGGSQLKVCR